VPQPQGKALAFAILCLGCFVAFLDIQIVSASIEEIGGGLSRVCSSNVLADSPDDMSWVPALTGADFAVRSLTYARPIVDLRAFGDRNFTPGLLVFVREAAGHARPMLSHRRGHR
jgi:hypothetical protein